MNGLELVLEVVFWPIQVQNKVLHWSIGTAQENCSTIVLFTLGKRNQQHLKQPRALNHKTQGSAEMLLKIDMDGNALNRAFKGRYVLDGVSAVTRCPLKSILVVLFKTCLTHVYVLAVDLSICKNVLNPVSLLGKNTWYLNILHSHAQESSPIHSHGFSNTILIHHVFPVIWVSCNNCIRQISCMNKDFYKVVRTDAHFTVAHLLY